MFKKKELSNKKIEIRLTESEKNELIKYAETQDLKITELVKNALNEYMKENNLTTLDLITIRQILIDEIKSIDNLNNKNIKDYKKDVQLILKKLEIFLNVPEKMKKCD